MDKKIRPMYILPTKESLQNKRQMQTENERMQNIYHANEHERNWGSKINFKITLNKL